MKKLLFFALVLAAIGIGVSQDRRRRPPNPRRVELEDWESEGGAVPTEDDRTAAQTTGNAAHAN
jgi:hypothetical protein